MAEKYDVFVGNLTFNTTEEQLREVFQFVGPVKNIRLQTDKETGKPKGFAFVEYYDTNSALSAIKHLDQTELNGRKIKVGYPSQSNLKDIARQIGHVVPNDHLEFSMGLGMGASTNYTLAQLQQRQQQEQNVINSLKLHEAWDILDAVKTMVMDENRGQKVRKLLEAYPQLMSAIYEIENRLGIALPSHVQQHQQLLQQQILAGASNATTANTAPMQSMDNSNSRFAQSNHRGYDAVDYYGPDPNAVMSVEESGAFYGRDSRDTGYYGEDMGGTGMREVMANSEGGGNRLDIYGPNSASRGGGGRVSRFGAPDHSAFLTNANTNASMNQMMGGGGNGGGNSAYYDSYGNEMYLQDYSHNH